MCFSLMRLCSPPTARVTSPHPQLPLCGQTARGRAFRWADGQWCPRRQAGSQSRHFYLLITPGSHLRALCLSGSPVRKLTGAKTPPDTCPEIQTWSRWGLAQEAEHVMGGVSMHWTVDTCRGWAPALFRGVSSVTDNQHGLPGMGQEGTASLSWGACSIQKQDTSEQKSPDSNLVICSMAAST